MDQYDLEIYYDQHIFEIYINDGYYVLSQIVYELDKKDISLNKYQLYNLF